MCCAMVDHNIPPELYALFLSSLEKAMERIQASCAEGDLETLSFHAHAIRGTCGAYGHEDLSVLAGLVEDLADAGKAAEVRGAVTNFYNSAQAALDASVS